MNETLAIAGLGAEPRSEARFCSSASIPWLDGALLRYLVEGSILEIKTQDDLESGPIEPQATVVSMTPDGHFTPTLPPASKFDAIFSRDALVQARDPRTVVSSWFEILRPHGTLVLVLSQAQILFPRTLANDINSEGLAEWVAQLLDSALPTASFHLIHLDTVPRRQGVGGLGDLEIHIVVQKNANYGDGRRGLNQNARAAAIPASAEASFPFSRSRHDTWKIPGMRAEGDLLIRDFAPKLRAVNSILVLKLDHHGDLIIALPALRELRQAFPAAKIRLVCGSWNLTTARSLGLFDDVRGFDYFPERALEWNGAPIGDWKAFALATEGHFDVAIDMRVDDDTRALLARVDAGVRCGIGSQAQFPTLDIALPDLPRALVQLANSPLEIGDPAPDGSQFLGLDAFHSNMEIKRIEFHESRFFPDERCLLRSEAVSIQKGRYNAEFDLSAPGFFPGPNGMFVEIEVIANGEQTIGSQLFGRRTLHKLSATNAAIAFESLGEGCYYEFRVRASGKPLSGRLRFSGLRLRRLDKQRPRYRPSELHVGEKLSLLISLVRQRTPDANAHAHPFSQQGPQSPLWPLNIIIAPFSNSTVRDWPIMRYAALIDLLIERFDCRICLIGSPAQREQSTALMALLRNNKSVERVVNQVGETAWSDIPNILRAADLVICNNSGIAHQAAELGARTLAIYSASHQPLEWGPRGPRSRAIMMNVACSPCGYERIEHCDNQHACMRQILPETVIEQAADLLSVDRPE